MADGTNAARIRAVERAPLGHVNLRGDPGDAVFLDAVRGVLGVALPLEANTVAVGAGQVAYWLGPNEWLVVADAYPARGLLDALRSALGDRFAAVTDVSGGQTVIELHGAAVRDLLAQDCPLDLHPRALATGRCAQTRLGKMGVLLRPLATGGIELVVRRSFCNYFWRWLAEAARDYGLDAARSAVQSSQPGSPLTTEKP